MLNPFFFVQSSIIFGALNQIAVFVLIVLGIYTLTLAAKALRKYLDIDR